MFLSRFHSTIKLDWNIFLVYETHITIRHASQIGFSSFQFKSLGRGRDEFRPFLINFFCITINLLSAQQHSSTFKVVYSLARYIVDRKKKVLDTLHFALFKRSQSKKDRICISANHKADSISNIFWANLKSSTHDD